MIFQRSPNVPTLDDPLDYRDLYLRPDFQFRCAYCLTHEHYFLDGEAGEVDHHRPLHPPKALRLNFLIFTAFMAIFTGVAVSVILVSGTTGQRTFSMQPVSDF